MDTNPTNVKCCSKCGNIKENDKFIKDRNICKECNNNKRRIKYETDEEHRIKLIEQATNFKQKKIVERNEIKEKIQEEIGIENKNCIYCNLIQPKKRFRTNRLKCRNCERDDPRYKLIRKTRSRIWSALTTQKEKHTVEYLGCSNIEYIQWITNNEFNYTIENHGKEWHIDHVIPLCLFDINNVQQQLLAFNWRNTMPLAVKENLSKNKKIIPLQIAQHLTKLLEYHEKNNIKMPKEYIDLFAKHLVAGSS